jgi:hypothetical protein
MREQHLWLDRPNNRFVLGLNAANPVTSLTWTQGDKIELYLHNAVANPSVPASVPFLEQPLPFTGCRASVGGIDAPANRGSFCFKVGDQTTAALNWPTDTSAGGITTFKAACLAALLALSNVGTFEGNPAISDSSPASTPVNFFYYTWADPTRTDAISVVNNRLLPLCQYQQEGSLTALGYTQIVKITQFPMAMQSVFTRNSPPALTIGETQLGAAGVNEEQVIAVPSGATGSVAFVWNGAQTASLAVASLTADGIASVLNSIVANGATNPSFAVTDVSDSTGPRFSVEFIGPLAAAAQALLGIAMIDQQAQPWATGVLDLTVAGTALATEQLLNGAPSAETTFELVIINDSGEETFLLPLTIENDMTDGTTETQANLGGAISTITNNIVVDNSTNEAFASVAPGASFAAPAEALAAGTVITFTHGLDSLIVFARAMLKTSSAPETWRELQRGGEWDYITHVTAGAGDANNTDVTFAFPISATSTDPYYHGNIKVYFYSPDDVLQIFGALKFTWDQCLASLPDGQTLTAKLAALDAAIGMVGGSIQIAATNITGTVDASQVNIEDVAAAFQTSAAFLTTLQNIFGNSTSNATLIKNIALAFANSPDFVTTLTNLFASNAALLNALIADILANNTFVTGIGSIVAAVLQGGAATLSNALPITLPAVSKLYPPLNADGSAPPLPAAQVSLTDLGDLTYWVPPASGSSPGDQYEIASDVAYLPPERRKTFHSGDTIFSTGADWFRALIDSGTAYDLDAELSFFTIYLGSARLAQKTQFVLLFQFAASMAGANCEGYCIFELRRGTPNAASGPGNLSTITWDETVISVPMNLTDAIPINQFGYTLTRGNDVDGSPAITAQMQIDNVVSAAPTNPASPNLVIQARLTHFDAENVPRPVGQFKVTMAAQVASIVKLP